MTLQEFFYLTMSLAAIVATASLIYIAFVAVNTLRLMQSVLKGVKETGENLSFLKEGVQLGAYELVSNLLNKLRGGGDEDG